MRRLYGLLAIALFASLPSAGALAQQPLHWHPTLESAKQEALRTNRLVLIHFWADWCHACKTMDKEVFSQPQVAAAVEANYVPVKINADFFPARSKQYGVTALPTDVILTSQGQPIQKFQGVVAPGEYIARLNHVAASLPAQGPRGFAETTPGAPADPDDRYADYYRRRGQPPPPQLQPPPVANPAIAVNPAAPVGPAAPVNPAAAVNPPGAVATGAAAVASASAAATSDNPPLALDGYCPVELTEKSVWSLGNRAWGARHRGRTYLFSGPEQQQRFLANPDHYAPVLSGNDVVIAVEAGKAVPGYRQHGVFFADRVYLFANEDSLMKFSKAPHQYAQWAAQATQASANLRRQLR
jgi:YHS domain-containing protein/thiol-disulfide isomerase/thioredoxin